MEDINENTKNLYIVRRRLAERTKRPGVPYFEYFVGNFLVKINPNKIQEHKDFGPVDRITHHNVLQVSLYEEKRYDDNRVYDSYVDLEKDSRFKNYKPIKYHEISGYSDGREMPINHLCELIIYLHRLSNLSAFM
jgi:hypothetical protein